jgi:hypothetical protein
MWPRYGAPGNSDIDSLEGVNKNITLPYDNNPRKKRRKKLAHLVVLILLKFITSKI